MNPLEIFRSRIHPRIQKLENECWTIPVCHNGNGYKYIRVRPKRFSIHRISFEAHKGAIPDGISVLHKCDNPGCCNPDHLFFGSQYDNIKDMDSKGRRGVWHPHGEINPAKQLNVKSKLKEIAKKRERDSNGRWSESIVRYIQESEKL